MMIISDGYSAEYYPQSNQIVITMPQTARTLTTTVQMVTNRKVGISDEDLCLLVEMTKYICER